MISYDDINLKSGGHSTRANGTCFMEAVAWIAGEEHSDHPACVCPTLGVFLRNWNDALPDEDRQKLKPYLRLVIGTANDGFQKRRSWMALDWFVRTFTPAWLDKAGLSSHAEELRSLEEISDEKTARYAESVIKDAWAAAWAAAGAAAGVAGDAAWDAAWAADRGTAWAAAGAARAAAGGAARSTAWDSARAAAGAARYAARAAAWDADRDALQDTVVELQASAFKLLDDMLLLGFDERQMPEYEIKEEPVLVALGGDEVIFSEGQSSKGIKD